MKTKFLLLLLFTAASMCGCGTTEQNVNNHGRIGHFDPGIINRISVGMTKEEVVRALGQPESVSASDNVEVLSYIEERPWWQWKAIQVRLVNGKVTQFGEKLLVQPASSATQTNASH